MKNKKIILSCLIVFGIVLVIIGFVFLNQPVVSDNKKEDDKVEDDPITDPPVEEKDGEIYFSPDKKEKDDIEVVNFKYSKKDDSYLLTIDVYNNSKVNYSNLIIYLKLYDKDGNYVHCIEMHLGEIKSGKNITSNIVTYNILPEFADYELLISKNSR